MPSTKRFVLHFFAIALTLGTTGCFTPAVWRSADETVAIGPEIAGVVRDYPFKGERSLVICYRAAGDGIDVDLVVPIRKDGSPIEPFKFTMPLPTTRPTPMPEPTTRRDAKTSDPSDGIGRILQTFPFLGHPEVRGLAGLTPAKLEEIQRTAKTIAPDRPRLEPHLKSADFTPAIHYKPSKRDHESKATDTVQLLSYVFDSKGQIWPGGSGTDGPTDVMTNPRAGVFVIAVPTAVPRPPGDRESNKVVAEALTPLAVTGDAALIGGGVVAGAVALVVVLPV